LRWHRGWWAEGRAARRRQRARALPQLEQFEDRFLPALTVQAVALHATEGAAFSGKVASFIDPDLDTKAAHFTATIAWGDGQSSAGTVKNTGSGTFNVTGSHAYTGDGSNALTVAILDADGSAGTAMATATVADATLTATAAPVSAVEGQPFNGTVATFRDANPGAPVSDFRATAAWGDGTTSACAVSQLGGPGTAFTVSGSHTYAEAGSFAVSVTIDDGGGSAVTARGHAAVADAPLTASAAPVSAVAGQPFNGTVATLRDDNSLAQSAGYTVTITWGDGQTSTVQPTALGNGQFTISGSHT
jgi:hypothetical protein